VSLLEVSELSAGYGRGLVLHGVSFSVEEGQIVSILGPNGAGKTTTLRAISGMLPEAHGSIAFAGRELRGRATDEIAQAGIAHVPEGRGTFTELTVAENLLVGAFTRRDRAAVRADAERCCTWFPRLGERRDQRAGTLSGGEQQMLAVARALMLRPRLLLLDEPSLGLAPLVTRELFRMLEEIARGEGITVLIVEQNANLVLRFADHGYVLESGRIALDGDAESMLADESVQRSYLAV
jgi:branched-chain amino acid transport system ATP-binding protein